MALTWFTDTKIKVADRNSNKNFTYSFRVFLSGCRYWDTTNNTWSTEGCEVSHSDGMVSHWGGMMSHRGGTVSH